MSVLSSTRPRSLAAASAHSCSCASTSCFSASMSASPCSKQPWLAQSMECGQHGGSERVTSTVAASTERNMQSLLHPPPPQRKWRPGPGTSASAGRLANNPSLSSVNQPARRTESYVGEMTYSSGTRAMSTAASSSSSNLPSRSGACASARGSANLAGHRRERCRWAGMAVKAQQSRRQAAVQTCTGP